MTPHVLDTDILTLFQENHPAIVGQVLQRPRTEVAVAILSVEEQLSGWYGYAAQCQHGRYNCKGGHASTQWGSAMAELVEGVCCPLCGEPVDIHSEESFLAFPCVGLKGHRYQPLDDSVVHKKCLSLWRKRDYFVSLFNEALAKTPLPLRLIVSSAGEVTWSDNRP
jgi:hypothetical protein